MALGNYTTVQFVELLQRHDILVRCGEGKSQDGSAEGGGSFLERRLHQSLLGNRSSQDVEGTMVVATQHGKSTWLCQNTRAALYRFLHSGTSEHQFVQKSRNIQV